MELEWLRRGMPIEALSSKPDYLRIWWKARVLRFNHKRVEVQYQDFDDGEDPKRKEKEIVPRRQVRPRPLPSYKTVYFLGDKIDVWEKCGWWIGQIIEVVDDLHQQYRIYFLNNNAVEIYHYSNLRPALEFVSGVWQRPNLDPLNEFVSESIKKQEMQRKTPLTIETKRSPTPEETEEDEEDSGELPLYKDDYSAVTFQQNCIPMNSKRGYPTKSWKQGMREFERISSTFQSRMNFQSSNHMRVFSAAENGSEDGSYWIDGSESSSHEWDPDFRIRGSTSGGKRRKKKTNQSSVCLQACCQQIRRKKVALTDNRNCFVSTQTQVRIVPPKKIITI